MSSKTNRPVLLLNWNYHRADITEPLLKLSEHFEIVFLHDYLPSEKTGCVAQYKRIFWNNYSSPYALLSQIKPAKILFYDIESFHQTALLIAARNRNIKTVVLEHGLRGGFEIDIEIQKYYHSKSQKAVVHYPANNAMELTAKQSSKTLMFYFRAIRPKNIFSLHWIMLFIYYRKKFGLTYGLYKIKRKFRWADLYINFTERNSSYIQVRDGVPLQQFRMAGNPAFDYFFNLVKSFEPIVAEPYLLLLDAPFVEGDVFGMRPAEKNEFITKINNYAILKGCMLRIKLHPLSYKSDFYIIHPNIIYHTNDDLAGLILNSKACIHVHLSSLVPIAVLYKPYIFFNTYPEYNEFIHELQMPFYDFYHFKETDLTVREMDEKHKEKIIKDFLFSTDGHALERIKNYLED